MTTRDEQIGRNVQKLRGDVSQQALADLMRERGFKWSQATVWAVEKGERPLRVSEGEALTEALGSRLYKLTGSDTETDLQVSMHKAANAYREIQRWTVTFMAARADIELTLAKAEPDEKLNDAMRAGGGWLGQGPADAVNDGIAMWESED